MKNINNDVYLWKISEEYPQSFIGEYDKKSIDNRFIYKQGRRVNGEDLPVVNFINPTTNQLSEHACLASNLMVPIVNQKVAKTLLEIAPNNIQLIDVVIEAKDNQLTGYKILNVTIECDGLDEKETIPNYLPSTQHILDFEKFKYKKGCLNGVDIARSKKYHGHLIVSENIKKQLSSIKNLGVDFEKAS